MRRLSILAALLGVQVLLAACLPESQGAPTPLPPIPPPRERLTQAPTETPAEQPTATTVAGPLTLTYWEEESADGDVLLDEISAEFMKEHPGIEVERVHFGSEELREQFRAAALSGKPPELVRGPGDFAGPFSELGIVQPIAGAFQQDVLDQFFAGALAGATVKGKLWALPDNYGDHLMLLYNRDLVKEVPGETDAWIAQLKTLTDASREQYGLVYDLNEPFWLLPWIGGFGGWPLDAMDNPSLASQAMVNALQFVQDLKFVYRVLPLQANYDAAYDMFRRGKAAYVIDGMWNFDRYKGADLDFGVTVLPKVRETGLYPSPMTSGKYWFISKGADGPNLEAAKKFVEYMTSAQAQHAWLAKMGRLPSNRTTASDELITQNVALAGAMDQLSKGRGLQPAPDMRCAWNAMRGPLEGVMDNTMTPADAAKAMQAEAERCIAEMTGTGFPAEG